jgi:hypothetical protein
VRKGGGEKISIALLTDLVYIRDMNRVDMGHAGTVLPRSPEARRGVGVVTLRETGTEEYKVGTIG